MPQYTVTVGTGGDYASINEALSETLCPRKTVINLLSGFVMAEQVLLADGLDYGHVRIQSEDPEVQIARSELTERIDDQSVFPAFGGYVNVTMPVIDCMFNMDSSGPSDGRDGLYLSTSCVAVVMPFCGIKNAGGDGCSINRQSEATLHQSIFSGAGENGIHLSRRSEADAAGSDISNCELCGLIVQRGSILDAHTSSNATGCGYGLYVTDGSTANAAYIDVSNSTFRGLSALHTSRISAPGSKISGCGADGIWSFGSSNITANNADITGCGAKALYAMRGGRINAPDSDASGAGSAGAYAFAGGHINVHGANTQIGSMPSPSDMMVIEGSEIIANRALGGTNQAVNTITTNGIIFG